jgi:lipopolysaccharide transport system permease protein
MRQVYLPKQVFPYIVVLTNTFKFLIVFALLILFLFLIGTKVSAAWIVLPLIVVLQLLLLAGIGSFLAAFVPIVPDLKVVIDNALMLALFLSGIFFDIDTIPNPAREYILLNPMAGLLDVYRGILIRSEWPDWNYLLYVAVVATILLILGGYLIRRLDRIYPKIVL